MSLISLLGLIVTVISIIFWFGDSGSTQITEECLPNGNYSNNACFEPKSTTEVKVDNTRL
jgi:hypothetical protein